MLQMYVFFYLNSWYNTQQVLNKLQTFSGRNFIPERHDSQCDNGKTSNSKQDCPHPEPKTQTNYSEPVTGFQNYQNVVDCIKGFLKGFQRDSKHLKRASKGFQTLKTVSPNSFRVTLNPLKMLLRKGCVFIWRVTYIQPTTAYIIKI